MFRTALTASLALAVFASAARAESGTPEERNACRHDVVRLCKGVPPEEFPVLGCLKDHRARLSRACRYVLESHGQ